MFINMALPFLTPEGLQAVDQSVDLLVETLLHQCVKSDCTWQQLLKAFCFRPMHREIEAYLHQTRVLSEDTRKQVLQCLLMNECQFDLQTVKEYSEEVA